MIRLWTFVLTCFVAIIVSMTWTYTPDATLRATLRTVGRALTLAGYYLMGVAGGPTQSRRRIGSRATGATGRASLAISR